MLFQAFQILVVIKVKCPMITICFFSYSSLGAAVLTVPFIDNMMLGRTFDYSKSLVGNDIFIADAQKSIESSNNEEFKHHFKVISYLDS